MSKCVGALLARNEAGNDRYLRRVLANIKQFVDEIVVLDDDSTDETAAICRGAGAIVHEREGTGGWWKGGGGLESAARSALWALASERASAAGWVLTFDADMLLTGIAPTAFRRLLAAEHANAWAWPLLDCWDSEEQHRVDGAWALGWQTPRVWLACAMPAPGFEPQWDTHALHSGHLPHNYPLQVALAPNGMYWLHLAYVSKAHRQQKYRQYKARQEVLSEFERAHAESIAD